MAAQRILRSAALSLVRQQQQVAPPPTPAPAAAASAATPTTTATATATASTTGATAATPAVLFARAPPRLSLSPALARALSSAASTAAAEAAAAAAAAVEEEKVDAARWMPWGEAEAAGAPAWGPTLPRDAVEDADKANLARSLAARRGGGGGSSSGAHSSASVAVAELAVAAAAQQRQHPQRRRPNVAGVSMREPFPGFADAPFEAEEAVLAEGAFATTDTAATAATTTTTLEADADEDARVRLFRLDNGLRVAWLPNATAPTAAFALVVECGSRDEGPAGAPAGATRLLERMAFSSSVARPGQELCAQLQDFGGNLIAAANRESVLYLGEVMHERFDAVLALLADAALRPLFLPRELAEQCEVVVLSQTPEVRMSFEGEVSDALHAVAFPGQPMAAASLLTAAELGALSRDALLAYHARLYRPERMVLACSHPGSAAEALALVERHFGRFRGDARAPPPPARAGTFYVGGLQVLQEPADRRFHEGEESMAHVAVGWRGAGLHDEARMFAMAALQQLVGSGGAWSSGGPGKGMYTRIYRNLASELTMESAACFQFVYDDCALFGVQGTVPHGQEFAFLQRVIEELADVAVHIEEEEFLRAKNLLKTSILTNLENRQVVVEDLARTILLKGMRSFSPAFICRQIDELTVPQLQRCLREVLETYPTLVYRGREEPRFPSAERVQEFVRATVANRVSPAEL